MFFSVQAINNINTLKTASCHINVHSVSRSRSTNQYNSSTQKASRESLQKKCFFKINQNKKRVNWTTFICTCDELVLIGTRSGRFSPIHLKFWSIRFRISRESEIYCLWMMHLLVVLYYVTSTESIVFRSHFSCQGPWSTAALGRERRETRVDLIEFTRSTSSFVRHIPQSKCWNTSFVSVRRKCRFTAQ